MNGEVDEGRRRGGEDRRRETKSRPGWELLRRDKKTGEKEEGRSRAGAKTEADLRRAHYAGAYLVWSCMAW